VHSSDGFFAFFYQNIHKEYALTVTNTCENQNIFSFFDIKILCEEMTAKWQQFLCSYSMSLQVLDCITNESQKYISFSLVSYVRKQILVLNTTWLLLNLQNLISIILISLVKIKDFEKIISNKCHKSYIEESLTSVYWMEKKHSINDKLIDN